MNKIINVKQAITIAKNSRERNKTIALGGGCFDILHAGHIYFLEQAKEKADLLFILPESDENIKIKKGLNRPINSQINRSIVLSALTFVDYIIPLKGVTKSSKYDKLIVQIKPDLIVLTRGDKNTKQRREQTNKFSTKLVEIKRIKGISSTNYINNIK